MADVFVNSAAVGGGTGADWPNAFTTIAAGIAAMVSGDRLILANTHSETATTNITFTMPGNNTIISSTVSGTNTITYSPATSVQFSITSANNFVFNGNDSSMLGCFIGSGTDLILRDGWYTEDCHLCCGTANTGTASISVSGNDSTWRSVNDVRRNLSSESVQPVIETLTRNFAVLLGGTVESARTVNNTNHMAFANERTSTIIANSVDCSGFSMSRLASFSTGYLNLTKLRLSPLTTESINASAVDRASEAYLYNVDNSNEVTNQEYYAWEGEVTTDTSIGLDTTNPSGDTVSLVFDTSANTQEYFAPLRYEISFGWADFSTAKTFSVEFVQDGVSTLLNNAQVWIELRAPDGTTSAYDFFTSKSSNNGNGVNYPASTAAWTGLSATNSRQTISLTTDGAGKAGPYTLYFCLSPASTTVNVNPKPSVA